MNNKERQQKLDKKKWDKGVSLQRDPSGSMDYCYKCNYQIGDNCGVSQEQREKGNLCAAAYNKKSKK